ncbi:MAG: LysM peptidoglycan-binding domain-containing protein [Dethiobacter sp.]|jgi:LysM repeat protein|nr:LysM peptidoglycan-binding domain-containing protein [Dethiobacter sp.]
MSPLRKTGITAYRKAAKLASTEIIPEPPKTCDGYLYKVKEEDSLYKIAKKFKCSMQRILRANPQLSSRSGTIFVRQLICIPDFDILPSTLLLTLGPQVLSVELLDATGTPLQVLNGFTILAPRTFIRVVFSEPVSLVYFFFAARGKMIFRPSFLIGIETLAPPQRSVRFIWDVPVSTRGSLYIVGCNQRICGPAEEILVCRI